MKIHKLILLTLLAGISLKSIVYSMDLSPDKTHAYNNVGPLSDENLSAQKRADIWDKIVTNNSQLNPDVAETLAIIGLRFSQNQDVLDFAKANIIYGILNNKIFGQYHEAAADAWQKLPPDAKIAIYKKNLINALIPVQSPLAKSHQETSNVGHYSADSSTDKQLYSKRSLPTDNEESSLENENSSKRIREDNLASNSLNQNKLMNESSNSDSSDINQDIPVIPSREDSLKELELKTHFRNEVRKNLSKYSDEIVCFFVKRIKVLIKTVKNGEKIKLIRILVENPKLITKEFVEIATRQTNKTKPKFNSSTIKALLAIPKERLTPGFEQTLNKLKGTGNYACIINSLRGIPAEHITHDFIEYINKLTRYVDGDYKAEAVSALLECPVERLTPIFAETVNSLAIGMHDCYTPRLIETLIQLDVGHITPVFVATVKQKFKKGMLEGDKLNIIKESGKFPPGIVA